MSEAPIGFFDSGLGGLTIRREVMRLLPGEHTVYLADSAEAPYGEKTRSAIIDLSRRNTRWLLEQGSKLIVVACNTATTNAIDVLRKEFPVPFVGIEPAIKPAALQSESKRIGVLATRGTLSSSLFANTSRLYASGIEVMEQEGRGLVRLIEAGKLEETGTRDHLRELLRPMLEAGIDPRKDLKTFKEGGTHDNVVMAVESGAVDAGTVRSDTLERMHDEGKINIQDFKIINRVTDSFPFVHSTRLYPEWPLAVCPGVDKKAWRQVAKALMMIPTKNEVLSAAKIYKYKVVSVGTANTVYEYEKQLNDMAFQGWTFDHTVAGREWVVFRK